MRTLDTRLCDELAVLARSPGRAARSDRPRGSCGLSQVRFALPSVTDLSRVVARAVDATSPAWDLNLAELEAYTQEHRTARPPRGTALGEWCERQRIAHRRGLLPPDRAAQLRSLTGWVGDLAEQRWLDQCAQVAAGAYRTGRLQLRDSWAMGQHLNVRDRGAQVKTVGQWCAAQRQQQRPRRPRRAAPQPAERDPRTELAPAAAGRGDLP